MADLTLQVVQMQQDVNSFKAVMNRTFAPHDFTPRFLDLSAVVPQVVDVKWLPPVPNLVVWIRWLVGLAFGTSDWTNTPELLANRPSQILPRLSHSMSGHGEEQEQRFNYWFAFLLCGPPMMGCMCEVIRFLAKLVKQVKQGHSEQTLILYVHVSESEMETEHERMQRLTFSGRKAPIVVYHVFCICLVAVALSSDWLSAKGGGTICWELWALWQHTLLWALFIQNLLRCYDLDAKSLEGTTFTSVVLYTAPIVSELADTMKDWLIAGICLMAEPSVGGFTFGAILVVGDLLLRTHTSPPSIFPFYISDSVIFWSPIALFVATMLTMFIVPYVGVFLIFPLMAAIFFQRGWICFGILWQCALCNYVRASLPSAFGFHDIFNLAMDGLTDGGCLFLISSHVILIAYYVALSNDETSEELSSSYLPILALPTGKPSYSPEQDWITSMGSFCSDKLTGFLSSARLVIAWAEDWPQGFIGLLLVFRYGRQMGKPGFATLSAVVSFLKGVLLPLGQKVMLEVQLFRARREVVKYTQLARYIEGLSAVRKDAIIPNGVLDKAISDRRRELFFVLGLAKAPTLYQPVRCFIEEHFLKMNKDPDKYLTEVSAAIVSSQRENGDGMEIIMSRLFDYSDCYHGGFTFADFIEAKISLSDRRKAGFPLQDFIEAKISLWDCREAGFTLKRFVEAKISLKDCKEVGFTKEDFIEAKISKKDCEQNGFTVTLQDFIEAKISLSDCKKVGFTKKDFIEAKISKKDCEQNGFTVTLQDFIKAKISHSDCRKAGFTLKRFIEAEISRSDCRKAGFTLQDFIEAKISLSDCRKAGFTKKDFIEAKISKKDCEQNGFTVTLQDFIEAKISHSDCREAGFSVTLQDYIEEKNSLESWFHFAGFQDGPLFHCDFFRKFPGWPASSSRQADTRVPRRSDET